MENLTKVLGWAPGGLDLHATFRADSGLLTLSRSIVTKPDVLVMVAQPMLQHDLPHADDDDVVFTARAVGKAWDCWVRLCASFVREVDADLGPLWQAIYGGDRRRLATWYSTAIEIPTLKFCASAIDDFNDAASTLTGESEDMRRALACDRVGRWLLGDSPQSSTLRWVDEMLDVSDASLTRDDFAGSSREGT